MSSIFYHSPRHRAATSSSPLNSNSRALYSFSISMMDETLSAAEEMIQKWNPEASTFAKFTSLFYESRREAKQFINTVMDLQRAMQFLASENSNSVELVRAQNLMQIAMKRLQKELYQILSTNRAHLDPESISGRSSVTSMEDRSRRTSASDFDVDEVGSVEFDEIQVVGDSISEVERVSALAMSDLKAIADCMISTGYGKECVQIYKMIRKSIVDEGLYRLGVERLNPRKVHKLDWDVLDIKIKSWLKAVKIAVKTLFTGERILCDYIFSSSDFIRESCFNEISRDGALMLFQFPELIAVKWKKKSHEKMFRSLDLYDSIANLWQDIESTFSSESTSIVRSQSLSSLIKLSESVRTMLSEFESTIQKDSRKSLVQGGGIHPLTTQTMGDLCLLADYTAPLSEILISTDDNDDVVRHRFAWLILVLLCKLDGKADRYKDAALSYLFLANNLNHVLTNVTKSNLNIILGDEWIAAHQEKLKLYTANYVRMGWNKVVSSLPTPGEDGEIRISVAEAKSCLERFNVAFEATYRLQASWVVPDSELRDEIKVSICKTIGPVYREFLDKFGGALFVDGVKSSLVRYDTGDLGNYISDLFYGTGVSGSSSSHSSGSTSTKRNSWSR
ncbi:hypothetical protein Sjap_018412 [Stephania japonica]|uniref:Exocyst subunit Exo70 family protein n=1 Tax=Stephania japonica TaxID=461633 RepID=A0AAP0I815_9MAGN